MDLSGHPPVPPKQMFGLWISEYGYENWAEVDGKIASLKAAGFPLSGIVLDLYWFGGINPSTTSRMGTLTWDETRFPDPRGKIAALKAQGIGTMLIEESYVSSGLPEYAALAGHHALAHDEDGAPVVTNPNGNWWGKGGMIDWTTPAARDFWHDYRRQALIDMDVMGHWTDLGEPEMISPAFRYGPDNLTEAAVHQSYNALWLEGIFEGYRRNSPDKRPFMMSRSGGIGIQGYGAAMWSGDTGGDYGSLAAQMAQQTHMMWSGMDYYGSDVGGFHRGALGVYPGSHEDATNELYTQWLAYAALFEVPVRPHTENLCNCKETTPDRIGDIASNLANLRLRYALLPYYYSAAYRAWLSGEPVFPSLDYWFPDDPTTRGIGHVKMIGSELVAAAVAAPGASEVKVYLPKGKWYEFRSGAMVESAGETFTFDLHIGDLFELPVLARDGAIVPMADGVLRVFGTTANEADWYDDDGRTTAYQQGDYEQVHVAVHGGTLTLSRVQGSGIMPKTLLWSRPAPANSVTIDGVAIPFENRTEGVVVTLPQLADTMTVVVE
jgi:alpha-glucosidase